MATYRATGVEPNCPQPQLTGMATGVEDHRVQYTYGRSNPISPLVPCNFCFVRGFVIHHLPLLLLSFPAAEPFSLQRVCSPLVCINTFTPFRNSVCWPAPAWICCYIDRSRHQLCSSLVLSIGTWGPSASLLPLLFAAWDSRLKKR